ncbi:hypothetical protein FJV41_32310 [Myxococcus llanfairpwllgwyngyllgogerychwyrndrobwllllantysiliogogogochensis]|uniref:Lipoprotein n=1 Tax=Myxococcus llanfairpwllgwyngyllgogerychwyrndrobwllllantysiliogogogochensis TaxID=2590453 RepID=A0A540WS12_9BACT|nr:hypothetical protein [Myxococcus llanfairpwllgwyngyllgogerychwyrndrobwllllantysiliogogogochensis]TQF11805.1 hypothetical protein FJV41_32310 [Myxococcus llanfairpwllgwyngyllgogerychwyrndrobwllllantysiliogogogochensis]
MKSVYIMALLLSLTTARSATADGGKTDRLRLKVIKHESCTAKPKASEVIRFSSSSEAPLREDSQRGAGCYFLEGPVVVRSPIRGGVHAYAEVRYGTQAPREKCKGADSSNCGGIGSCVYCNVCSAAEAGKAKASGFIRATRNGKALDCEKGISAGSHSDWRLSFCMPTKDEYLKVQGMDEDFWSRYGVSGRLFYMTVYLFDKPVNALSESQMEKVAGVDGDGVIGCHRIVATVLESGG